MAGPYDDGIVHFAPDLRENIETGDANYLSMLDEADAYVARNGLDLPEEPQARILGPDPDCLTSPILELNLAAGITSIIGRPASPTTSAGCRSTRSTRTASRTTSAAYLQSPESISWACPGCRGADRASSGGVA